MSGDCIFCKLVAGDVPASKVYEDESALAFMDIMPVVKGHVLVIPKAHHEDIHDAPAVALAHVIAVVKKVAAAQKSGLGADGINVTQANGQAAGQIVPHIHFHVIPRFNNDGHTWNNPQKKYDSDREMAEVAAAIRDNIGKQR